MGIEGFKRKTVRIESVPSADESIDLETASEDHIVVYRGRILLKEQAARRTDPDWAKELEEHLEHIDEVLLRRFNRTIG